MKAPLSRLQKDNQGSIIVSILITIIFLSTFIYGLMVLAQANLTRAKGRILLLQAQYAAETATDVAIAQLNNGNESFAGTVSETTILTAANYRSTFTSSVAAGSNNNEKIITAVGMVYSPRNTTQPSFTRRIKVTAQRTSTSTTSSMVSRNILDIQSSVKDLKAIDIFVNNYVRLNKNSTTLIAENITAADKYTDASNCSIAGAGALQKPTVFYNPGQTKTNIITAYNNCASPPGNSSNTNFEVSANNTTIGKIQSTYIPWAQYMDSSYQSSPGGCSDWTTGSFPRDIPSTGNTKKTHYPDNGSNISTSCGTSGNIDLASGQYNIKDHIHLRASLCQTVICTPTFYNPDSSIKFVFVEGAVAFDSLQTASGSGPIAFVTYGSDPSSKADVCPLGGAMYLGNGGTTNAPKIYLVANNGLCLDKTKFGAAPAIGGVSGKNLYIATNSGTPFDLTVDPSFPVTQIPVNLAWRAARYQRQ